MRWLCRFGLRLGLDLMVAVIVLVFCSWPSSHVQRRVSVLVMAKVSRLGQM
jgi:hypothetical protein